MPIYLIHIGGTLNFRIHSKKYQSYNDKYDNNLWGEVMKVSQIMGNSELTKSSALSSPQTEPIKNTLQEKVNANTSEKVTISLEALSLSQAEINNLRWSLMTQSQLKEEAQRILAPITGYTSDAAIAKADAEVPNTDDPEILARAKQATAFLKNDASNPFLRMSRETLVGIVYDDSGSYTTNERMAALSEQQRQDSIYWRNVFAESTSQGSQRAIYKASIDYYNQLSPLERAIDNYPPGYAALMQVKMNAPEDKDKTPYDEWPFTTEGTSIFTPNIDVGKYSIASLKEDNADESVIVPKTNTSSEAHSVETMLSLESTNRNK